MTFAIIYFSIGIALSFITGVVVKVISKDINKWDAEEVALALIVNVFIWPIGFFLFTLFGLVYLVGKLLVTKDGDR